MAPLASQTIPIAPAPARCATPNCAGKHVRTVRVKPASSTEWVMIDLCFDCRGAVLDNGHRYVILRRGPALHRGDA
jgi:Zn-finger nucleic acid-binding protein